MRTYSLEPEVHIHLNAPPPERYRADRPTRLIFYALPNGNTIAQTVGCRPGEGVDWRYQIQHIGAQTRRLREVIADENIVVAYLEAQGRSWPAWKSRHADYRTLIPRILASVAEQCPGRPLTLDLSGHSGGGSFIFGYLDSVEAIPREIRRISFLDSNYGYSDASGHGDKLLAWLRQDPEHHLGVICYDDRDVLLDGKHIVGPQGGTWRATERMIRRLEEDVPLQPVPSGELRRYRALGGRIDIIMHPNPRKAILHTALVGEMSGFLHVTTFATRYEETAGPFNGKITFSGWIQEQE